MKSFRDLGISLDDLLSKLSDLIQVINQDGKLLHANQAWLSHLNYTQSEADYLNFFDDILQSPFVSIFQAELHRVLAGDTAHIEVVLRTKSGAELPVEGHLMLHSYDAEPLFICVFHELNQRHQQHLELERMFSMSVDMLGVADFDGNFLRLNPAWERVLGYSLNELIGQPFINFVHPDDVAHTKQVSTHSLTASGMQTYQNRYLCKDGSIVWLQWHYIAYQDMQQTYFVARDITEEYLSQSLLQETRDQLQGILDNSGTMIGLKNLEGKYILVNQEFADLFSDGDKSALVGKTDYQIFKPTVAQILETHDQSVLQSNRSLQFEESIETQEGVRTYLTTRFLLEDNQGIPYASCMIAKDITYRKLTEMQLLMRNQAIEHSPSGISIADARLPDMPLIYINPAFERTTGYSALDVIGRNCRFLQNDDRNQEAIPIIRQAIQNKESVTVVLRNYHKNGDMFYSELRLAPIRNREGYLTHYVGISTDVTERIEAEAKIQKQNNELTKTNADLARARKIAEEVTAQLATQNQALMSTNRDLTIARRQAEDATTLKSQFLATMSHELRTPLNAIIGYTEIQLAGMTGAINDEQRDYQERILTNAEHLLNLINDVLDISKIEAGRLELVSKEFALRDWVERVQNQVRVLAEEKGLQLVVNVEDRMPEQITGDPARLKQIVINLLSNAVKFTETGAVYLNIRKQNDDAWLIIVQDTGIGIPSHMQEIIFEEFRQVDSSSKRKAGGTGLGLAIVRKLLLMMGGTIRLASHLGEGSTFTITLPFYGKEVPLSASNTGGIAHD
ncbi:MAG: PAS domain S-box protein [Chloroflexota bacterium]